MEMFIRLSETNFFLAQTCEHTVYFHGAKLQVKSLVETAIWNILHEDNDGYMQT